MDIFDRIQYVIDREGYKNLAEFSRKIDIKYETLRGSLKYKKSYPGYTVLKNIIIHVEWVNPDWLMTGRGNPERINETAKDTDDSSLIEINKGKIDRLLAIIESQQRTIENLSGKNRKQMLAESG